MVLNISLIIKQSWQISWDLQQVKTTKLVFSICVKHRSQYLTNITVSCLYLKCMAEIIKQLHKTTTLQSLHRFYRRLLLLGLMMAQCLRILYFYTVSKWRKELIKTRLGKISTLTHKTQVYNNPKGMLNLLNSQRHSTIHSRMFAREVFLFLPVVVVEEELERKLSSTMNFQR